MSEMFSYCGSIDGTSRFGQYSDTTIPPKPGKFPKFTFTKDCKVGHMFERCHIPVDLSASTTTDGLSFGLNNVRDYSGMFLEYAYFALPKMIGGAPENLTVTLCSSTSKTA